jgi:hypothetical protein
MGCSTKLFRVATEETGTIAGDLRQINVYAYNADFAERLLACPYLPDATIEYPAGSNTGQAGWDVAFQFTDVKDLAEKLEAGVTMTAQTKRRFGDRHGLPIRRGEIARLAVMAHGQQGGEWSVNGKKYVPVMAKPGPTAESVESLAPYLHRIGLYTRPGLSTIILMGCLAGQGQGGTELLMALSQIWPGRKVVAFDVLGNRHPTAMFRSLAEAGFVGEVGSYAGMKLTWFRSEFEYLARQRENQDEIDRRWPTLEWASESSKEHAKVVLDGKVLQCPAGEVCPENGVYPTRPKQPTKPAPTPKGPAPIVPSWKQRPPLRPPIKG